MIHSQWKKNTVFRRSFLSLSCILLSLILIFLIALYCIQMRDLQKNTRITNEQICSQLVSMTDMIFDRVEETTWSMMYDSTVLNAIINPIEGERSREIALLDSLSQTASSNRYIANIYLLVNQSSTVYSSSMTINSLESSSNQAAFGQNTSNKSINGNLQIIADSNHLYYRVNYLPGFHQGAVILVELNRTQISALLNIPETNLFITTEEEIPLFDAPADMDVQYLTPKNFSDSAIKKQGDISILYTYSSQSGLHFYYGFKPEVTLFDNISSSLIGIIICALLLIFGLLLAFGTAYHFYKPVSGLIASLRDTNCLPDHASETDEWRLIHDSIQSMSHTNSQYQKVLGAAALPVLDKLLYDLLSGISIPKETLPLILSNTQSGFSSEGIFNIYVITNGVAGVVKSDEMSTLCNELNRTKKEHCVTRSVVYHYTIVTLVQYNDDTLTHLDEHLRISKQMLQACADKVFRCKLCGSEIFYHLDHCGAAYERTVQNLWRHTIESSDQKEIYQQIAATIQALPQKSEEDGRSMLQALQMALNVNPNAKERLDTKRHLLMEIIKLADSFPINLFSIHSAWSIEEMEETVLDECLIHLSEEIVESINVIMKKRSHRYIVAASKYLRQNFTDPDISLEKIAAQIGVNNSYLSRLFSDAYGKSFNQYLRELRISEAKRLLADNTLLIRDISQATGFLTVQTFMRVFKQSTGITPSEYRAIVYNETPV